MIVPGLIAQAEFPGVPKSAAKARAFVRRAFISRYGTSVEDAVLLVSELVGNAVRHSDSGRLPDGTVRVTLSAPRADLVRVEVCDDGSAADDLRPRLNADQDSEGGRGLRLVDLLADKWGSHVQDHGRVVWFEMSVSATG
ncbi:ATP-binding protein [Thermopolyspora sp. NPDC052614]|uniref:ATP-binding protein n=1 Tax=Thermopolyspora sp. NPDC052614 TaxID=3155682 RepID=UPI00341561CF